MIFGRKGQGSKISKTAPEDPGQLAALIRYLIFCEGDLPHNVWQVQIKQCTCVFDDITVDR